MQNTDASLSTREAGGTSRHLLDFADVQERLRCSRSQVFVLAKPGAPDPIPTVRIGGKRMVREQDLDAWIDRRASAADAA